MDWLLWLGLWTYVAPCWALSVAVLVGHVREDHSGWALGHDLLMAWAWPVVILYRRTWR